MLTLHLTWLCHVFEADGALSFQFKLLLDPVLIERGFWSLIHRCLDGFGPDTYILSILGFDDAFLNTDCIDVCFAAESWLDR